MDDDVLHITLEGQFCEGQLGGQLVESAESSPNDRVVVGGDTPEEHLPLLPCVGVLIGAVPAEQSEIAAHPHIGGIDVESPDVQIVYGAKPFVGGFGSLLGEELQILAFVVGHPEPFPVVHHQLCVSPVLSPEFLALVLDDGLSAGIPDIGSVSSHHHDTAVPFHQVIVVALFLLLALWQHLVEFFVVAGTPEHLSVDVSHPEASVFGHDKGGGLFDGIHLLLLKGAVGCFSDEEHAVHLTGIITAVADGIGLYRVLLCELAAVVAVDEEDTLGGRGDEFPVGVACQVPAGVGDTAYAFETLVLFSEEPFERTHIESLGCMADAEHLAGQAVGGVEVGIGGKHVCEEHPVVGGSPYVTIGIGKHGVHVVVAESSLLCQMVSLVTLGIGHDEPAAGSGEYSAAVRQLVAVVHGHSPIHPFGGGGGLHNAVTVHRVVFQSGCSDGGLYADFPLFLANVGHLADKSLAVFREHGLQRQFSPFVVHQITEHVESAHPDSTLLVLIESGDAENARGMHHVPFRLVIAEQSLEVGYVYPSLPVAEDIEVTVVCAVGGWREIHEERMSHRSN